MFAPQHGARTKNAHAGDCSTALRRTTYKHDTSIQLHALLLRLRESHDWSTVREPGGCT
jgi:hypothetical protein